VYRMVFVVLVVAGLMTSFVPAQITEETACKCGEDLECSAAAMERITNLTDKAPDLVICTANAAPNNCKFFWAGSNTRVVGGVQEAIREINDAYAANNPRKKLNVIVDGHGFPGIQCFGKWEDKECIGYKGDNDVETTWLLAKTKLFVEGVQGTKEGAKNKIKDIIFLGCHTAKGADGQRFLSKLRGELNAERVKGWTGKNRLEFSDRRYDPNEAACGTMPACNGTCTNAANGRPRECWNNGTDGCRCVEWRDARYETEGEKRFVPTMSGYGIMVLLLAFARVLSVKFGRRRGATTVEQ